LVVACPSATFATFATVEAEFHSLLDVLEAELPCLERLKRPVRLVDEEVTTADAATMTADAARLTTVDGLAFPMVLVQLVVVLRTLLVHTHSR